MYPLQGLREGFTLHQQIHRVLTSFKAVSSVFNSSFAVDGRGR